MEVKYGHIKRVAYNRAILGPPFLQCAVGMSSASNSPKFGYIRLIPRRAKRALGGRKNERSAPAMRGGGFGGPPPPIIGRTWPR